MKRFLYLGVAVLVVVIGWTLAWYWAAGEVRKGADMLAEADGIANPRLTCNTLDVAGFPFRFDVTCAGATIVSGDLTVSLAGLKATVLVYRPTHALASAKGPLTLTDAFSGGSSRVDWTGMELSARLEGWRLGRVSLVADTLSWNDTLLGDMLIARADHFEAHLVDIPERHQAEEGVAALAFYAKSDRVEAPGLAIEDGDLSFEAELSALPDDVRSFADPAAIERWRQLGGTLDIFALKGTDGDTSIDGSGTLALNNAAQLEGEVTIASKGVVETLEPLLAPGMGPLVFGSPAADGTYSQTLKITGGVVYSGMLAVGAVPPLL